MASSLAHEMFVRFVDAHELLCPGSERSELLAAGVAPSRIRALYPLNLNDYISALRGVASNRARLVPYLMAAASASHLLDQSFIPRWGSDQVDELYYSAEVAELRVEATELIAKTPLSTFKLNDRYAAYKSHAEVVDDCVMHLIVYLWCALNWDAFIAYVAEGQGDVEAATRDFPRYFDSIAYHLLP